MFFHGDKHLKHPWHQSRLLSGGSQQASHAQGHSRNPICVRPLLTLTRGTARCQAASFGLVPGAGGQSCSVEAAHLLQHVVRGCSLENLELNKCLILGIAATEPGAVMARLITHGGSVLSPWLCPSHSTGAYRTFLRAYGIALELPAVLNALLCCYPWNFPLVLSSFLGLRSGSVLRLKLLPSPSVLIWNLERQGAGAVVQ